MKKINLTIKGMHCPSCETLIKDSLEETDGVKHVDISAQKGSATVEFDEKKITKEKIIFVIKKEGYEAR